MKISPLSVIFCGLFLCSVGFNILYHVDNQRLIYKIQKLEAGPARGLFLNPAVPEPPKDSDKELDELLKQMIRQMIKERVV